MTLNARKLEKLKINKEQQDDLLMMNIIGEIDASSSLDLDEAIRHALEDGYAKILVDCGELNYISSAGLGVFMSYIEDFKSKNVRFSFFNMSSNVYSIFKILGFHKLLFIADSENEAKIYLNEA